ncbi:CST complex subunit STN1 [Thoreauomyces humboldtii]|nr:CST complex subunit STN1 [Thoreauomyces humboldtii]
MSQLATDSSILGLDQLFWVHCRLSCRDVLALVPHPTIQDVYFHGAHPVRKVEITGIVVGKEESSALISYSVDDGTAVLPCVSWFSQQEKFQAHRDTIPLGYLVKVTGRIADFRSKRQLTVNSIVSEEDPNVETLRWLETVELTTTVYDAPAQGTEKELQDLLTIWMEKEQRDLLALGIGSLIENQDDPVTEYKEALGIFQTENPTEGDLKRLVRLFIVANDLIEVPFSTLRSSTDIVTATRQVLRAQSKAFHPSDQRINSTLASVVKILVQEGFMYHRDTDADVYEIIRHDINLGQAVLKLVQVESEGRGRGREKGGISEEEIVYAIRRLQRFKLVPRTVVEASIGLLLSGSDIYEVERKQFKSID